MTQKKSQTTRNDKKLSISWVVEEEVIENIWNSLVLRTEQVMTQRALAPRIHHMPGHSLGTNPPRTNQSKKKKKDDYPASPANLKLKSLKPCLQQRPHSGPFTDVKKLFKTRDFKPFSHKRKQFWFQEFSILATDDLKAKKYVKENLK